MPLGNGEIGVNAWVEPSGELVFYLGTTDAWDDNGRLLKVGRVRVSLDPAPTSQAKFRQTCGCAMPRWKRQRAKFRTLTLTLSRMRERGQETRNFVTGCDTSGCASSDQEEV